MQLSAINSVNFQGRSKQLKRVKFQEPSDNTFENRVEKAEEKAKQDVHLSTIIAGVGIMAAAVVKGKNIIALATKAVATAGEYISKGAVKAVYGAVNAIRGEKGAISPEKALDKISGFASALRNENPKTCTGFVEGAKDFVGKIFGEDKGEMVANFLTKNGMDNKVGLIQGAAAGAVGAKIADGATDTIEGAIDDKNISKAQRADEAMSAIENLGTVISALAE